MNKINKITIALIFSLIFMAFPRISHALPTQADLAGAHEVSILTVRLYELQSALNNVRGSVLGVTSKICFSDKNDTEMLRKIFTQEGISPLLSISDSIRMYQLKYSNEILVPAGLGPNNSTGIIGLYTKNHLSQKYSCN